jgi:hypothetical protein
LAGSGKDLRHFSSDLVVTLKSVRAEIFSLGADRFHKGEYNFEILTTPDRPGYYSTPLRFTECEWSETCGGPVVKHPNIDLLPVFVHSL